MGRRTLVVHRRADGRFDCRYAHWGVTVDPVSQSRPLESGVSAEAVLARLDASFERVLVRGDGGYCVCWLDPTLEDPDDIAIVRTDDPESFRAYWTVRKGHAVAAVADGAGPGAARAELVATLEQAARAAYLPGDTSFLYGDR